MPAQVASARVFRYRGALREYSEARDMEPDRYWRAMLLVVTAADSLFGRKAGRISILRPAARTWINCDRKC